MWVKSFISWVPRQHVKPTWSFFGDPKNWEGELQEWWRRCLSLLYGWTVTGLLLVVPWLVSRSLKLTYMTATAMLVRFGYNDGAPLRPFCYSDAFAEGQRPLSEIIAWDCPLLGVLEYTLVAYKFRIYYLWKLDRTNPNPNRVKLIASSSRVTDYVVNSQLSQLDLQLPAKADP